MGEVLSVLVILVLPLTIVSFLKSLKVRIEAHSTIFSPFDLSIKPISDLSFWKSLLFFYFLKFEKADCSIFALLVGRSVGRSVDVTINFSNIYRHKSPLLTQYHSKRITTKLY